MSADLYEVIDAAEDAAFYRYAEATGRVAQLKGYQPDLFGTAADEAREWRGIYHACLRARREAEHGC